MQTGNKVDELKSVLQGRKEAEKRKENEADTGSGETGLQNEETEAQLKAAEEAQKKAEEQARENQDKYVRLYAEFENYRKRVLKDKEEAKANAEEKMIQEILPLLDDIQLALQHAEKSADVKALVEGMKLMQKQVQNALQRLGIETLNSVGQSFDPHIHEAVSGQPSADHAPNTVIQEFRAGYKYKGKLIRPAMVVVSQ